MQRVRRGLYQLEAAGWVNAYLIEGPRGLTLVDTGHSKAADALGDEIERSGFSLQDLEQVLITHAHFDHVGGAAILMERKRVKIYAHPSDIPSIKGERVEKALHRRLSSFFIKLLWPYRPLEVLVPLQQGQTLRALPNWQVLHTPGHTAGSLSLYQPTEKIIISGDAIRNERDKLNLGPSIYNEDMAAARESARRLSSLDCEVLCCGHGPVIRSGASLRLQKLVASFACLLVLLALPARAAVLDEPRVKAAVEAIKKSSGDEWAKRFVDRVKQAEKGARSFHGCVAAGKLSLKGPGEPDAVSAQMAVFPGGYFADAYDPKGRPLGFRAPGYDPLDVRPECEDGLAWLEPELTPTAPERLGAMTARVEPKDARVSIYPSLAPTNVENSGVDAHWACKGRCPEIPRPKLEQAEGNVSTRGLSPIEHGLSVSAPGYVASYSTFSVKPGETTDAGLVTLERAKVVTLRWLSAEKPPFKGAPRTSTATAGGGWTSFVGKKRWWHEVYFEQKDGLVRLSPAVGPADISDLGPGKVEDFAAKAGEKSIDPKGPYRLPLVDGHVYLLRERYFGRWLLFSASASD